MNPTEKQWVRGLVAAGLLLLPLVAQAASGGVYAWETTLQKLIASITGPVANGIGVGAIALFGFGLAFSDGGGIRILLGILFGLSIAFSAVSLVSTFFGFGGGAVF